MASPFPNFDVGDIVDVSLNEGGLMENAEVTYVPENSPGMANTLYWELLAKDGSHVILGSFIAMRKKA